MGWEQHERALIVTEGVIQFAYELEPADVALPDPVRAPFAAWRTLLQRLALLGQTPERYGGLGYGNLSVRESQNTFVITASQTSGEPCLHPEQLVRIIQSDPDSFRIRAFGRRPPSSEAMTHACIYAADPDVQWVMHVHSADLWSARARLQLPRTAEAVGYGTRDMVEAVRTLLTDHRMRPLLFATDGHTDGIFAIGGTAADTGALLLAYLARALEPQAAGTTS